MSTNNKFYFLSLLISLSIEVTLVNSVLYSPLSLKRQQRKQYYSYASILPIIKYKNTNYIVLRKIPSRSIRNLYGDFGGKQNKADFNNPLLTAIRQFSAQTKIDQEYTFNLIKQQCTKDSCVLKDNTGRCIIYPLEIPEIYFDFTKNNKKFYSFIELQALRKALRNNINDSQFQFIKGTGNSLVTLKNHLVEALLNNINRTGNNTIKNLFDRFS